MDSLSSEDTDEESSNTLRDTGHPSFKKVKRTRMNVDHLTEDEKHLRKRLLGRERARRYRERKRAVESFFEAVAGRGGLSGHKPRGVQQKRTCSRKKRKKLSRFASVSKEIAGSEGEQDRSLSEMQPSSPFSSPSTSYYEEEKLQRKVKSNDAVQNPEAFPVSSLLPDRNLNPGAILEVSVPILEVDLLDKDARPLNKEGAISSPDRNLLTFDDSCHFSDKNMEVKEAQDSQIKKFSETLQASRNIIMLSKQILTNKNAPSGSKDDDELTENTQVQKKVFKQGLTNKSSSGSKDDDELTENTQVQKKAFKQILTNKSSSGSKDDDELTENPQGQKKAFKQQNVKDFINLFPVEQSGQNDRKTPLSTCNSGMQRKVECVRRSKAESDFVKRKMAIENKPAEGEHGGQSVGEVVESMKLPGVTILTSKPDEQTQEAHSVEPSQPQAGTSVPQATLTPLLPIAELPLPIVLNSTSAQPFAMAGLHFQQTHQNTVHMPSVMQQQFIGAVGNIHALNTLQASGQSRIVNMQDLKQTAGVPGIIGLPNLQGVGGIHGVHGVQGILGNPVGSQGGGGLQSTGGIQGLFGGINGVSGLQGVSNLLGIGSLSGITGVAGPTSSTGFTGLQSVAGVQGVTNVVPSLQGISNFQAAVQGIPALQGVTALQGLVNLQTLSTLQGIQGLQGVGISALQSQQALAGLQAITGASPLQQGFSVQTGTLDQLGIVGAVGQDSAFNQIQVLEPATSEGVVSDTEQKPIKLSPEEEKEISPPLTSSTCPAPNVTSQPDLQMCTPEKKQLYPICKGRSSRRKQASPRCISKRKIMFFESKEDSGEEEEENEHIAWASVTENMEQGQQNSTDLETRSPSSQSPVCMKSTTSSPKLGSKLSKKVEELLSASNPESLGVKVECPTDPVDDESPSPQTWRRFLERERQRNDRLREVEQQLAKLQVLTAGASSVGSTSFTSMSTQTDPQDFLAVGDGAEDRLVKARTNLLWQTTQGVIEHTERNRRASGQIQQRDVTSSGDPLDTSLALDANKSHTNEMDCLAPFHHSEMPQPPSFDIEGRTNDHQEFQIVNRPGNYWLHSVKKKRIAGRKASTSVKLKEGTGDSGSNSTNQEEMRELSMINEEPLSLEPQKKKAKKYIYQISPENAGFVQAGELLETAADGLDLLDGRADNQTSPLQTVKDAPSGMNAEQHLGKVIQLELSPVLPWDVEGLTKIERNRIRAREGMRRHREKLKMAKLSNQGWRCLEMPGTSSFVETTPQTQGSKTLIHSGYLSPRGKKGCQKLKSDSLKCSKADSKHNKTYIIANDSSSSIRMSDLPILSGEDLSQKTFQVFTPVAVETESKIARLTSTHKGRLKTQLPAVPVQGLGKEALGVLSPVAVDAAAVQTVNPGTHVSPKRRERRRKGWLKSEQRFEKNATLLEMPKDSLTGSLPASDQIDFTQEPYRSMSLRERNRIRAREGMRRYRERLKMARQPSHQAHQRVTHRFPRSSRGTFKRVSRKMELDKGTVSVEDPSPVPKEISEKNPANLMVSYSEMVLLRKTELFKRRRSIQLLKTNEVRNKARVNQRSIKEGNPHGESIPAGVFIKKETVLEEETQEHTKDPKLGHVKSFPVMRQREQGSTSNENTDLEKSLGEEVQENRSLATVTSVSVADEVLEDAEEERLSYIEKMKEHLEAIRRQRRIDEKIACGMDRYAAISSSQSTAYRCIDDQVIKIEQELEEDSTASDEETPCTQFPATIKPKIEQPL